jgi:hypothetical protein
MFVQKKCSHLMHIYAHTHEHIQINHTIQLSLTGPQSCEETPCKGRGLLHPGPTTVLDRASILWRSPLHGARGSSPRPYNCPWQGLNLVNKPLARAFFFLQKWSPRSCAFSVEPKWSEREIISLSPWEHHIHLPESSICLIGFDALDCCVCART